MKSKAFNTLAKARFDKCMDLLNYKSEEYSRNEDKLHNFKRAAQALNIIPEEALIGMKVKHDISILDIVNDIKNGILPSVDLLSEKITDEINYLILLEALINERMLDKMGAKEK